MKSECEHFDVGTIAEIEDSLGLRIPKVSHNGCVDATCPPRGCRNAVLLSGARLSHFTTARAGYITPQHTWESVCSCNGTSVCLSISVCLCFRSWNQTGNWCKILWPGEGVLARKRKCWILLRQRLVSVTLNICVCSPKVNTDFYSCFSSTQHHEFKQFNHNQLSKFSQK